LGSACGLICLNDVIKTETRNWLTDLVAVSFSVCKQQSSPSCIDIYAVVVILDYSNISICEYYSCFYNHQSSPCCSGCCSFSFFLCEFVWRLCNMYT